MKFNNIEEQAAFLNGYDQKYHQISAGTFQGQFHNALLDDDVKIYIESFNQTLDQRGATPPNRHAFMFFMDSSNAAHLGTQEFLGDDILYLPPGHSSDWRCPPNTTNCVIDISRQLFEEIIQGNLTSDKVIRKTFMEKKLIRDKDYTTLLRHTVKFIFQRCEQQSIGTILDGAKVGAKKSLCELLFGMLANQELPGACLDINVLSKNANLTNKIKNFIKDRKGLNTDPSQIVQDFGISRRHLETIFKNNIGITPSKYIQIVKLNEFRSALVAEKNLKNSIGDIAADFDFWHLSRLAQNYKLHFGELPSETRKNLRVSA